MLSQVRTQSSGRLNEAFWSGAHKGFLSIQSSIYCLASLPWPQGMQLSSGVHSDPQGWDPQGASLKPLRIQQGVQTLPASLSYCPQFIRF